MYSIGELSKMSGVSKHTLRYYDEKGILKPCKTDLENGYRYYNPEQLKELRRIIEYKSYGFSLKQIKSLMTCSDNREQREILMRQYNNLSSKIFNLSVTAKDLKLKLADIADEAEMRKILVVDDADFLRNNVTTRLMDYGGFIPIPASSGEEALELYADEKPWLVIMDIGLPGMDGIECTAKIRELDPAAQIVMLSIRNDDANKKAAAKAGACGFIAKPFKHETLLNFILSLQTVA